MRVSGIGATTVEALAEARDKQKCVLAGDPRAWGEVGQEYEIVDYWEREAGRGKVRCTLSLDLWQAYDDEARLADVVTPPEAPSEPEASR